MPEKRSTLSMLKRVAFALFACAVASWSAGASQDSNPPGDDGARNPVAIVAPFEVDKSGFRGHADTCRSILEDLLVNKGMSVVERKRLEAILSEQNFARNSTLADPATAVKAGKAAGANVIVFGTIVDITSNTTTDNSYKTRTTRTVTNGSIRVRVIDVETSNQTFSEIVASSITQESNNRGGAKNPNAANDALKQALRKLENNGDFLRAIGARKRVSARVAEETIEVTFEPKPEGCDVLIDGEFKGVTPLKLSLRAKLGVKVTLRKAGYEKWEEQIVPSKEMKAVKPELEKKAAP